MDRRRGAVAAAVVAAGLAGCATAPASAPVGGQAATTAVTTGHKATAAASSASATATTPASPSGPVTGGCGTPPSPVFDNYQLTGIEFVSPSQGWAVGRGVVLATTDGGAHWTAQLTGQLDLTGVDFVNANDGWAVGTDSLLSTTDGGAHWTPLAEPCPLIRSVHFTSALDGYAVAGGDPIMGSALPGLSGVVLVTHDGGHSWARVAAPANPQTVCFSDRRDGWLGAGGVLYRTSDGGQSWAALTSAGPRLQDGDVAIMSVQCAGPDTAWAVRSGPAGGMSQQPHVAYHANASGVTAIYAEQYFHFTGDPTTRSPGSYAGPFSALSPSSAVFIDSCAPCGAGTAPWATAADSGAVLTERGHVGGLNFADAAAFLSPQTGWIAGTYNEYPAKGKSRYQHRIVATTDGGKTWQIVWASPWLS